MPVKIIVESKIEDLEPLINNFIEGRHVINISLTYVPEAYIALVLYK